MKRSFYFVLVILLLFIIVLPSPIYAAKEITQKYYVDLKGNDKNPGTVAKPWRSIAYASSHVPLGQNAVIHINKGIFIEKSIIDVPPFVSLEGSGKDSTIIKSNFSSNESGIKWDGMTATSCDDGDWLKFENVNLGTGYKYFSIKMETPNLNSKNSVEVRLDSPKGKIISTLNLVKSSKTDYPKELFGKMTGGNGKHNVYIVFKGTKNIGNLVACRFTNYTIPQDNDFTNEKIIQGADIYLPAYSSKGTLMQLWSDPYTTNGNQSLSGFTIDGSNKKLYEGIFIRGRNNVKVHDIAFIDIYNCGMKIIARSQIHIDPLKPLTGIEVFNCSFKNCSNKTSLSGETGPGCSGALEIGGLKQALIHDNLFDEKYAGNGYGIKFTAGGNLHGVKIYKNKLYSNYNTAGGFTIELWSLFDDCEIYENTGINGWFSLVWGKKLNEKNSVKVHNNYISYDKLDAYQSGIEMNLDDGEICYNVIQRAHTGIVAFGNAKNISIHNNIIQFPTGETCLSGDGGQGVAFYGNSAININVFNNVFQNYNAVLNLSTSNAENINVKNNICMNVNYGIKGNGKNVVFEYNAINANLDIVTGSASESNNIKLNDDEDFGITFMGNNPDPYYRLKRSDSICHDAGVDVGFTFEGKSPDIGAIEKWMVGDGSPVSVSLLK